MLELATFSLITALMLVGLLIAMHPPRYGFGLELAGFPEERPEPPERKPWEDLLMFKKGGGSAPAPDPNIGKAALKNAELGEDWLAFAKQQFGVENRRQQGIDKLTKQIGEQQLETQDQANRWSREDRARYEEVFRPIEDRLVQDAMDWDSDARISERAAEAKADVMSSAAQAEQQNQRQMASMGINPASGRFAGIDRATDTAVALNAAGAQNQARNQVRGQGMALRADAANMGRGLPSQAASGAALGLTAGNSAQAGALNAAGNARANISMVGQGFGGAMQGYSNQANILNQQYQNQLSAWSANRQAAAQNTAGIASALGTGAGAAMMAFSSEDYKTDKEKIGESALEAVKSMPVESWRYKDGVRDEVSGELIPHEGERHVGTYAEDFKRETGIGDGKTIPLQDAVGVTMKAIQELDQKVERMGLPKSAKPKTAKTA